MLLATTILWSRNFYTSLVTRQFIFLAFTSEFILMVVLQRFEEFLQFLKIIVIADTLAC